MGADLLLETYLKRLRLPPVADNYRRFAQEAAHGNQPYERFLLALLEVEVHRQEATRSVSASPRLASLCSRPWTSSNSPPSLP